MISWPTKIAFIAGTAILALEIVTRTFLIPHSGDLTRLAGYAGLADAMQDCRGARIAFLGNSIAETGIDNVLLEEELTARGMPGACVSLFLADGSGMTTWRAMLRHYFWSRSRRIDVLVLVVTGPELNDEASADAGRLGRFLTSDGEWSELLTRDSLPSHTKVDAVASALSATIAVRKRLARRLTSRFRRPWTTEGAKEQRAPVTSHYALRAVLARARADGTNVVIVLFPVLDPVLPDTEAVTLVRDADAQLIDLSGTELSESDYADRHHLRPSGRATMTRALAPVLASLFAPGIPMDGR